MQQDIWIIGLALKISGGFCAFAGAFFTVLAVSRDEHENTRKWFRQKWESISKSPWLKMPEQIIAAVLRAKTKIADFTVFDRESNAYKIALLNIIVFFNIGTYLYFGLGFVGLSLAISLHNIVGICNRYKIQLVTHIGLFKRLNVLLSKPPFLRHLSFSISITGTIFLWVTIALQTDDVFLSFLAMLIATSCFFIFQSRHDSLLLGLSVGLSFSITFFTFWFGRLVSAESPIPQTGQMLLSNVLFDGGTMLITLLILDWAIKKKSFLRIPAAILLDVVVAAVLACASLYFGLFLSENHLSIQQVMWVLVGRSPAGLGMELGPYFWAMHTTFIPTFIYMAVILVAWIGKIVLVFIELVFRKSFLLKNPFTLTAALFALLATIFVVSGFATDGLEKYYDKIQKREQVIEDR